MSRRDFIKSTGLLAGGLLLNNEMLRAFSIKNTGEKIRVGVIGCGDRGKGIMEVMGSLGDDFQITAICDVLDFRLQETQKKFPAGEWKVYKEHTGLLADKNVDAVIIAVPLNAHYVVATDALAAG